MTERKKRSIKPIHEQAFGDILNSMDNFFNQAFKPLQAPRSIPIYQYETDNEYIIEAELPGIRKDQIILDIFQNYIKIGVHNESYTKKTDDKANITEQFHRYQRSSRVIPLPFTINDTDVNASLSKGLLQIRFPNKRKRITIDTKEV